MVRLWPTDSAAWAGAWLGAPGRWGVWWVLDLRPIHLAKAAGGHWPACCYRPSTRRASPGRCSLKEISAS